MADKTYSELLRDPRWQRKRLEIFTRDNWACTNCASTTKNLQVHHKKYTYGLKPWEYANDLLATLCEDCHFREGFEFCGEDEWSLYFRVQRGLLVDSDWQENNGAEIWPLESCGPVAAPRANASVSQSVLFDAPGRQAKIKMAIETLVANFKRGR